MFHVPYLWVFIRIPGCTHANQTTYGDDIRGIRTRSAPEWCGGSSATLFVIRTSRARLASARYSTFISIPGDRASRVVCELSLPRGGSTPQVPDVVITDDEGFLLDLDLPTTGGVHAAHVTLVHIDQPGHRRRALCHWLFSVG